MPLEAIALIKWVIIQHETGKYVKIKMTFEKLREYYGELMDSLKAFQTGKQAKRERAGCPIHEEDVKSAENVLAESDFAEDVPTAEELKLIARRSVKPCNPPQPADDKSDQDITSPRPRPHESPVSAAASPRSDDPVDEPSQRERHSSVSLDHEEPDDSHEDMPTPTTWKRNAITNTNTNVNNQETGQEEGEEDDEEEDADAGKEHRSSDDEEDWSEAQPPPKKKAKTTTLASFVQKLIIGLVKGGKL
ncbi:hypothetical protein FRC11_012613, partial [Ceratobasidium sp. 423]